jgi:hypothetical protein
VQDAAPVGQPRLGRLPCGHADGDASLPAAGTVRISATAAETALWTPGRYVGDIEFTIGSTVFSTADFVQEILADRTF